MLAHSQLALTYTGGFTKKLLHKILQLRALLCKCKVFTSSIGNHDIY